MALSTFSIPRGALERVSGTGQGPSKRHRKGGPAGQACTEMALGCPGHPQLQPGIGQGPVRVTALGREVVLPREPWPPLLL